MHKWVYVTVAAFNFTVGFGFAVADSGMVAHIGQSGDVVEFQQQTDKGPSVIYQLPLYRSGEVRYFSAGVGIEERRANYPNFSLKLVFTAGGKPFLTGVDVSIRPAKGGDVIHIDREQVEGPWLFVDLPSGVYDVWASQGDRRQELKGVKVESGKQATAYLRWAEDAGVPRERVGE